MLVVVSYLPEEHGLEGVGGADGALEGEGEGCGSDALVPRAPEHVEEGVCQRLLRRDAVVGVERQHLVQQVQRLQADKGQ